MLKCLRFVDYDYDNCDAYNTHFDADNRDTHFDADNCDDYNTHFGEILIK